MGAGLSNPLTALVSPPARLRWMSERWSARLRIGWMLAFAFSLLTVIVSTVYVLRVSYELQPVFDPLNLDFDVLTEDGQVVVGTAGAADAPERVPITSTVVAIDGRPIPPRAPFSTVAEALKQAPGPAVSVTLRQPDGKLLVLEQQRRQIVRSSAQLQDRNLRVAARMGAGLLACGVLLLCSCLLALRRPSDPVAMLFAFAFAGLAATIDPPLQMWIWTRQTVVLDIVGSLYFYLLLIALAAFPDGVFVPRFTRWLIPLGIPLALLVSMPAIEEDLAGLLAIGPLLLILIGQAIRFRRLEPGIERQQIKWTAFGFAVGLLLVGAALALVLSIPEDPALQVPLVNLVGLLLFSSGMAAMAIGLLVALTRFRLWEADTVITRSAAYAVVTLVVGVVWAASSDLVKLVITEVMGRESEAGATTVGAIIAAGIFSPTQSAVLGWTRRRFGGPMDRIEGAAQRLKSWGLTETPEEVATRALGIIDEAVHPAQAAVLLDTLQGARMVAARDVNGPDDRRLLESLPLADEEGPVGTLRLGRRSDGNRYNRQELAAVRQLIPHLADALRVARGRHSRESMLQQQIEEMATRLAQLEGGTPKPA